jgi:hypothetical protein
LPRPWVTTNTHLRFRAVAGFDFHVPKHLTGEALQRGLLRLIQGEARDLGLEFRYRSEDGELWGVLDGPLPLMYALRAYLGDDFPVHAAAATVPSDRRQRLRIASALLRAFDDGLGDITGMVHDTARMLRGVPNSVVFDYGGSSHLGHLFRGLTRTLILDMQGRVVRQTTVEDVHTTLENLLRTLLGASARRSSFAEMTDEAVTRGYISEADAAQIKLLKDVRREAKHRARKPNDAETSGLIRASVAVIHKLLGRLPVIA